MIGSATSRTSRPESDSKPSRKMPDSSSGAMTGSPSRLPSWKSSAPQPGAMWTMPVPSSSPTSSQATTRCSKGPPGCGPTASPVGGQVVERLPDRRQLVERARRSASRPARRPGAPRGSRTGPTSAVLSVPLPSQNIILALSDADIGDARRRRPQRRSRSASRGSSSRRAATPPVGRAAAGGWSGRDHRGPGSPRPSRLADARPAARAPGHRVVALVQPATSWHSARKPQMRSLFSLLKVK